MPIDPTLQVEEELYASGVRTVIGCDEVGRGAIAGPVAVGLVVVDAEVGPLPVGLRDSKLLPEPRREELAPLCSQWVRYSAVGLASPTEVDTLGIIASLGLAGSRALSALTAAGADTAGSMIVLDGNHDWFTPAMTTRLPLMTRIKADQDCGSVAAASVIAKVHRDRLMIDLDAVVPGYGWVTNKGYASREHYEAITRLGPTDHHRRTWLHRLDQPDVTLLDAE